VKGANSMTMLVDTLDKFAKELKAKKEPELFLIFKYNKIILREILEKLENGGLRAYFGVKMEEQGDFE